MARDDSKATDIPGDGRNETHIERADRNWDDILQELGLDWDRIIELKTAGAVT